MGMPDKQFNGFLRPLLDSLEEIWDEKDAEKKDAKFAKTIEHIRDTIKD